MALFDPIHWPSELPGVVANEIDDGESFEQWLLERKRPLEDAFKTTQNASLLSTAGRFTESRARDQYYSFEVLGMYNVTAKPPLFAQYGKKEPRPRKSLGIVGPAKAGRPPTYLDVYNKLIPETATRAERLAHRGCIVMQDVLEEMMTIISGIRKPSYQSVYRTVHLFIRASRDHRFMSAATVAAMVARRIGILLFSETMSEKFEETHKLDPRYFYIQDNPAKSVTRIAEDHHFSYISKVPYATMAADLRRLGEKQRLLMRVTCKVRSGLNFIIAQENDVEKFSNHNPPMMRLMSVYTYSCVGVALNITAPVIIARFCLTATLPVLRYGYLAVFGRTGDAEGTSVESMGFPTLCALIQISRLLTQELNTIVPVDLMNLVAVYDAFARGQSDDTSVAAVGQILNLRIALLSVVTTLFSSITKKAFASIGQMINLLKTVSSALCIKLGAESTILCYTPDAAKQALSLVSVVVARNVAVSLIKRLETISTQVNSCMESCNMGRESYEQGLLLANIMISVSAPHISPEAARIWRDGPQSFGLGGYNPEIWVHGGHRGEVEEGRLREWHMKLRSDYYGPYERAAYAIAFYLGQPRKNHLTALGGYGISSVVSFPSYIETQGRIRYVAKVRGIILPEEAIRLLSTKGTRPSGLDEYIYILKSISLPRRIIDQHLNSMPSSILAAYKKAMLDNRDIKRQVKATSDDRYALQRHRMGYLAALEILDVAYHARELPAPQRTKLSALGDKHDRARSQHEYTYAP